MARSDEIMMCVGCYCLKSDDDAKRHCDAGCYGCSHSFEPFLEIDGKLVPAPQETRGERVIRLVHELGVEDLDIPMICRPPGDLFSQTRVSPEDKES
jgi:hypothetical protein